VNIDTATVAGFGDEWARFDQTALADEERRVLFDRYFDIFPWADLPAAARGFDLGCGSGRWAVLVAPRVGTLTCIDASAEALAVARRSLAAHPNVTTHHASVDALGLPPASFDFGYSLGVLHHVPDTSAGLRDAVALLKPGAPFLLYLYYAFDNRPAWFRALWRASDLLRRVISRLPHAVRFVVSQGIALGVYWPLARGARVAERVGLDVERFPLSAYRTQSLYTMRTDALDRFGTQLEQRFTRMQIDAMMRRAGLTDLRFSESAPYWVACGVKAR
jgi:SAM-dependent methyltransferase